MRYMMRFWAVGIAFYLAIASMAQASEYSFNVAGRSDIEQEITIAKLLPFYHYMGGKVEVQWANPDLTQSVNKIILLLVKEGIRQQDIVRNYSQSMAAKNQSRDSINLVLITPRSRNHCSSYQLDFSFRGIGEESCTIEDNIDAMKLRK